MQPQDIQAGQLGEALRIVHAGLDSFIRAGDDDPDARIGEAFMATCYALGLPWEPEHQPRGSLARAQTEDVEYARQVIKTARVQYADGATAQWWMIHKLADLFEALAFRPVPQREEIAAALCLAKEATNGWACYAKRQSEHDEIARLHREIDQLTSRPVPTGGAHE